MEINHHLNEDYNEKYTKLNKIGESIFSEVYKVKIIDSEELRALKIIKLKDIRLELEKSENDVNIKMENIIKNIKDGINNMIIFGKDNDYSVKYYESYETENEFVIIMELCEKSLAQLLIEKKIFQLDEIYDIIEEINMAIILLKGNNIVHKNIKPNNIFIKKDKENNYKIQLSDFSLYIKDIISIINIPIETLSYLAPEYMNLEEEFKEYNYKSDLWSVGIIIYELCFQEKPYNGKSNKEIYNNIKVLGQSEFSKTEIMHLDDLITDILDIYPNFRLTLEEYLNHPFFSEYNCICINYKVDTNVGIHLFDEKFIKNNKNNCKIKYKNKYYELKSNFETLEEILEIQLIGHITNMSYMFSDCSSLLFISDKSKFNTDHVTDISYMFYNCSNLISLNCISNWSTINMKNMRHLFHSCVSLVKLPDISNWSTKYVRDMTYMFCYCKSLESLPDISKWNVEFADISYMFYYCKSLRSLPDISKWTISKYKNIDKAFNFCYSLKSFPDISNWEKNVLISNKITIICETYTYKTYEIKVSPLESIYKIEQLLKEKGYSEYNIIGLKLRDIRLKMEKNLEDYMIVDGDKLTVYPRMLGCNPVPINIYSINEGKSFQINICLCRKIAQLKQYIYNSTSINPENQELYFKGIKLDKQDKDLLGLGINENSTIEFEFKFIKDNTINYKEKYQNQIIELKNMGINEDEIDFEILEQCSGNIQQYLMITLG